MIELIFIYGLVVGLTFFEIRRSYISAGKAKKRLQNIEDAIIENEQVIYELQLLLKENQKTIQQIKEAEKERAEELESKLGEITIKLDRVDSRIV